MSSRYQIVIKGHLVPEWASWFGEIAVSYDEQDNTMLSGTLADQPALHGLLDRIRDLNLTLISVTQIEPNSDVSRILKVVALGMATAVLVLGILQATTMETSITMLSIGLFALALAALQGMTIGSSK